MQSLTSVGGLGYVGKRKIAYVDGASQVVLVVKNPPAKAGDIRDTGLIPDQEYSLEKGMATHSNILAQNIPWTEDLGELKSPGLQRVGHD